MLATPRDAEAKAIGFALTKDTTPDMPPTASPLFFSGLPLSPKPVDELGIQYFPSKSVSTQEETHTPRDRDDDLYFDEGLADELDSQHDGSTFDESIFDLNDTG
jgi:hypothetical protein